MPSVATEVRLSTNDGVTYSAPTMGEFGYIGFERVDAGYVLSIRNGDELVHQQP